MTLEKRCPCGSEIAYTDCCGIYHAGTQAPLTASLLMRSRFSAFALHHAGYLLQTWAENTRPATLNLTDDPTIWRDLKIIKVKKGGISDTKGQVEFKAYYDLMGEQHVMHELSRFTKTQGCWFYVDGIVKATIQH
ncbi:MAG: hypothetical protein HOP02_13960 [Methylococcaceae bacterium]|nr:hypothetical protein [Methylococcaceae bacterium]